MNGSSGPQRQPAPGDSDESIDVGFDVSKAPPKVYTGRQPGAAQSAASGRERVVHIRPPGAKEIERATPPGARVVNIRRRTQEQATAQKTPEDELDDSVPATALEVREGISIPADWMQISIKTDFPDVSKVLDVKSESLVRFQRESGATVFPISGTNEIIILRDSTAYQNATATKRAQMVFRLQRYIDHITSGEFAQRNFQIKVQKIGEHDDLEEYTNE